jgi:amidase
VSPKGCKTIGTTIRAISPSLPDVPVDLPLNVTDFPGFLLEDKGVFITQLAPEQFLISLASGTLTSQVVVSTFLRRSGLAQKLTNCITESLPERALERARCLDEYFHAHGKPIGPLHGLPISVKEHIGMQGLNQNTGFIDWCKEEALENASMLTMLWNAGAVFFRTNAAAGSDAPRGWQ